ncbi:Trp biosynthesis-associated membrane protein [Micrococcales bacterium 31B]|nr:Trp biosynthesis-associated membrane protein [Micrococcales bacterium 31B]
MRTLKKPVAVLAGLLLGALVLGSTRLTWMHANVRDFLGSTASTDLLGQQAVPALGALGVAMLAAAAAMTMARARSRFVYVVILGLLGAGAAAVVVVGWLDPLGAATSAVAGSDTLAGAVQSASVVAWVPASALVLCVAVLVLAVWVAVGGSQWGVSQRFSRDGGLPGRGEGAAGRAGGALAGAGAAGTAARAGDGDEGEDVFLEPGTSEAADDWDALSRGEELN